MRYLMTAIGLVGLALTTLPSPADASRVLYSYADKSGNTFNLIADGYLDTGASYKSVTCLSRSFCPAVHFVKFGANVLFSTEYFNGDSSGFATDVLTRAGLYYSTIFNGYADTGANNAAKGAMLNVVELADTDVVYAYQSRNGADLTIVNDGYITSGTSGYFTTSCVSLNRFCATALVVASADGSSLLFSAPAEGYTAFDLNLAAQPGVYQSSYYNGAPETGDSHASLTVTGPFAPPTAVVPEPSTWAMFLGGFGMIGCAMRRRRQAAVRFA